jgi:hypothetical protein
LAIILLFTLFFLFLGYKHYVLQTSFQQSLYTAEELFIQQQELRNEKNAFLQDIDINSDHSLQKFVNNTTSFEDVSYVPSSLEAIKSEVVFDSK